MSFAQRGKNNKPIETANLFGALLDEDKKSKKKKQQTKEPEAASLQDLKPLNNVSVNWADCADSDDEDMFGQSPFGQSPQPADVPGSVETPADDEEDEPDAEEEDDEESISASPQISSIPRKVNEPVVEKQLSKKELKRLEMEELDKALAELGMDNEPSAAAAVDPPAESPVQAEVVDGAAPADGKKKRSRGGKKKKPSAEESAQSEPSVDSEATTLDPELRTALQDNGSLDSDAVAKMLAARHGASKKKSSGSSTSTAAKEAAARKERAKKDKKKNKNNYNQQPTR